MHIILEIGCGIHEWHLRQQFIEKHFQPTPFSRKIAKLRSEPHIYCCLDTQLPDLVGSRRHKEERPPITMGTTVYVNGTGTKLPFGKESLDYIIMSDVLTTPPHVYCGCRGNPRMRKPGVTCKECRHTVYPGISAEEKLEMIDQAIRSLRIGGELIIGLYQSHQHATTPVRYLGTLVQANIVERGLKHARTEIPHPYHEQAAIEVSFLKLKTPG